MERKPTIKYFRDLGCTNRESRILARNWKPRSPQSLGEVRQGVMWERDNRERTAASWATTEPTERK